MIPGLDCLRIPQQTPKRLSQIPRALLHFNNEDCELTYMNNWQMECESQFLLLIKILNSHIINSSTMDSFHNLWHRQLAIRYKKEFNVHLNTIRAEWQKLSELQKFEVVEV